jgi:probable selenium-dependent hydroxylase accessory protein YqeC
MRIVDCLDISSGSDTSVGCVVAVIGCGGKTSLIKLIADTLLDRKVLISTTTKMFPLDYGTRAGVCCLGTLNGETGKLEALSEDTLLGLIPRYDVMLLEADGSRGLPLKGWLDNEPVIPGFCTHSVGIVTVGAVGKAATADIVHRLPEFMSLTGLRQGEAVTVQALEAMVCAPRGMFKNSVGRRYLLVNQVEDSAAAHVAQSFLQLVGEKYPNRFERLLYGSVRLDIWQEVWV